MMTWTEAISLVLKDRIQKKGLKTTKVSLTAGYQRNYLSKLFRGGKKFISNDELEPIAAIVGLSVLDINRMALKKKKVLASHT